MRFEDGRPNRHVNILGKCPRTYVVLHRMPHDGVPYGELRRVRSQLHDDTGDVRSGNSRKARSQVPSLQSFSDLNVDRVQGHGDRPDQSESGPDVARGMSSNAKTSTPPNCRKVTALIERSRTQHPTNTQISLRRVSSDIVRMYWRSVSSPSHEEVA